MCDNILFSKDLYVINLSKKKSKEKKNLKENSNKISVNEENSERSQNFDINNNNNDPSANLKSQLQSSQIKKTTLKNSNFEENFEDTQELDESYFVEQSKEIKDSAMKKICDIIIQPVS